VEYELTDLGKAFEPVLLAADTLKEFAFLSIGSEK
jgi:DNA-binding HxlR family transcriptional regulator